MSFEIIFGDNIISTDENMSQTFGNVGLGDQIKQLIDNSDKDLRGESD